MRRATSAYIDDILVNENVVEANRVEEHLSNYEQATSLALRWSEYIGPESTRGAREPGVEEIMRKVTRG